MADRRQVLDALVATIRAALTPPPAGVTLSEFGNPIVNGSPLPQFLEDTVKAGQVAVAVVTPAMDKPAKDEYINTWIEMKPIVTGLQILAESPVIGIGGTAIVQVSGQQNIGDAACVIINIGRTILGATYNTQAGDSLPMVAAGLAAAVNASSSLAGYVTATSSGQTVTLRNVGADSLSLTVRIGGTGVLAREVDRQCTFAYVNIYAPDDVSRDAVDAIVQSTLSAVPFDYAGQLTLADGTQALIYPRGGNWLDQTQEGVMRRVLIYELDWPVLEVAQSWSVEIPSATVEVQTILDPPLIPINDDE